MYDIYYCCSTVHIPAPGIIEGGSSLRGFVPVGVGAGFGLLWCTAILLQHAECFIIGDPGEDETYVRDDVRQQIK